MKRFAVLAAVLISLAACARLPEVLPQSPIGQAATSRQCRSLFPEGRWQLYHAIEATVAGGSKTLLTGAAVISSRQRSVKFALMTVEGFVLLRGSGNGAQVTVERAIAPFDRPGYAQGLINDLMLLFFPPQYPLCQVGRLRQADRICRYCLPDQTIDIILKTDREWEIRQYGPEKHLQRSVLATKSGQDTGQPFAGKMILRNHGLPGYQLELRLLEAVALH